MNGGNIPHQQIFFRPVAYSCTGATLHGNILTIFFILGYILTSNVDLCLTFLGPYYIILLNL